MARRFAVGLSQQAAPIPPTASPRVRIVVVRPVGLSHRPTLNYARRREGLIAMAYTRIENDADLKKLDDAVCWEDTELVEGYMSSSSQSFFPTDVGYTGHQPIHVHCLYDVCSAPASHLEIVFIGCETASFAFMKAPSARGHEFGNGDVEFVAFDGVLQLHCAAVIYRFIDLDDARGYFLRPGVLDYPHRDIVREGFHCVRGRDAELVAVMKDGVELTVAPDVGGSASATLDRAQAVDLADALRQAVAAMPRR